MTNARSFAAQLLARLSEAAITAEKAPVAAGRVTLDNVAPQVELGTALVATAAVTPTALRCRIGRFLVGFSEEACRK